MQRLEIRLDLDSSALTALCLEFANTADWHASAHPVESLHQYDDLLAWAMAQQSLSRAEQLQLTALAAAQPDAAQALLVTARDVREVIYRIFVALAAGTPPAATDWAYLNQQVAAALPQLQLGPRPGGYGWAWSSRAASLAGVLWPIVLSAAQLLTSDLLDRVKQCEDDRGCGFLFIDTSKNHSRRWCSMESCGNRAKVQRHRQRRHPSAETSLAETSLAETSSAETSVAET
ncbi:MAG: CGNR zinc finger domain-containing protein [Caldilineaceae bacterium]|nr:CGNR zinc finger domain-containing protein [Caldilineaceae bacterium]